MSNGKRVLLVRVNDELTLDAGWWEERDQAEGGNVQRYVHPPQKTMFEQVLEYLESLPPLQGYPGLRLGEEAVVTTAVCLRWGSYLAVLADRDKPLWRQARNPAPGRIADEEMARINVEASAALAQWIDLMRADWEHYLALMWAARRLPMTRRSVPTKRELPLLELAMPEGAAGFIRATETVQSKNNGGRRAHAEAEAHPSRVLANTLVNACWRNGPIESIHAGEYTPLPLLQRRITPAEERTLVRHTAGHLARAIFAVWALLNEQSDRSWAERVLPFNLAHWLKPHNWSLDEKTRQVCLSGAEPGATLRKSMVSHKDKR